MTNQANSLLLASQREYMYGLSAFVQTDINSLISLGVAAKTTADFERIVKTGYPDIVSSYGDLLSGESGKFYKQLRKENLPSLRDKAFNLPTRDDLYNLRRDASISMNTVWKRAGSVKSLRSNLMMRGVSNVNQYGYATTDFFGSQEDRGVFAGTRRSPSSTACAFCRLKAFEFSAYAGTKDGERLDAIELHPNCKCVPAAGFVSVDDSYLYGAAQDLFVDRLDEAIDKTGERYTNKAGTRAILHALRDEHSYR